MLKWRNGKERRTYKIQNSRFFLKIGKDIGKAWR